MRSSFDNDVTACVTGQRKKRFSTRWSIRQLIHFSPLLSRRATKNVSGPSRASKIHGKDNTEKHLVNPSRDVEPTCQVEVHQAGSKTSIFVDMSKGTEGNLFSLECPLCLQDLNLEEFFEIAECGHRACVSCLAQYLRVQITESRICISCPECSEPLHPNEIRNIINDPHLYEKYENFMVRRVLAVEPDTRWCPAPDCGFAVIASECASCPKLKCEKPGCDSYFCYHCKAEWHPNQTCDAARAERSPNIRSSSISYSQESHYRDDIKPCPRCQVLIVKMDDGSCNHMMCAVCGAEFCWLCMKEISDLHYLSPSGCTFWGKKPWSRKKKILWQLGTLVGAPVGIALIAGITLPAMIIGIPVWTGRKMFIRYKNSTKHKRNAAIIGGVVASVIISPFLAGLAVGIGVPILLFYVYGVVPVSLCRSGGCGGRSSSDEISVINTTRAADSASIDAVSVNTKLPNPSIGEASLSFASGSQVLRDVDPQSASNIALAGSVTNTKLETQLDLTSTHRASLNSLCEVVIDQLDDGISSTKALTVSLLNYKINGTETTSYVTPGKFTHEKTELTDNISFKQSQTEGSNDKSSCSSRVRRPVSTRTDNVCIDIGSSETKPKTYAAQATLLRKQFFNAITVDSTSPPKALDRSSNKTLNTQSGSSLSGSIENELSTTTSM